ncbi:MAG: tRNA pseudouridine(38-40) synthase TruA [Cyanobacteria bacterium P01_C01_bin.72]
MRIALLIQYLGTSFHGWQKQPNQVSVQGCIERAIASSTGYQINIYGAGRTDAGVHAAAQVAHFEYRGPIPAHKWSKIINARLPEGILVRASAQVNEDWHARFSAIWRRYRYTIYTDKRPNVFVSQTCWHYYQSTLNESLIQQALNPLVGEHSFAAFKRSGSDRLDSQVEVQTVQCYRQGAFVHLEIQANSFLYGMVRLLVGMLVEVGIGKRSPDSFTQIWQSQNRDAVKYSAPAKGLCLLRVGYPEFPFPQSLWFNTQPTFHLAN